MYIIFLYNIKRTDIAGLITLTIKRTLKSKYTIVSILDTKVGVELKCSKFKFKRERSLFASVITKQKIVAFGKNPVDEPAIQPTIGWMKKKNPVENPPFSSLRGRSCMASRTAQSRTIGSVWGL